MGRLLTDGRYRHNPEHPARLNKNGQPNATRQPRCGNHVYCLVWPGHDLFKVGLGSSGDRGSSARETLAAYLAHENTTPGPCGEWRAELPALEGAAWGDCQRLEMVLATAIKRRVGAEAAGLLGFEWLYRGNLELVDWHDELSLALAEALRFSGLPDAAEWTQGVQRSVRRGRTGIGGAQLDSHRTRRNLRQECALKGCGNALGDLSVQQGRFRYCSENHAEADAPA